MALDNGPHGVDFDSPQDSSERQQLFILLLLVRFLISSLPKQERHTRDRSPPLSSEPPHSSVGSPLP